MKIVSGRFWRVSLPLRAPIRTARTTLTSRDLLFVELEADDGTRGWGECVAFESDWYLPETLGDDEAIIPALMDVLRGREITNPREVDGILRSVPGAENLPMARAAVEPAIWDIFARQSGLPLARYLGFTGTCAPGGAVVPLGSESQTLAAVASAVAHGYGRVKLKISEPSHLFLLRAIRREHPQLHVIADANGAFGAREFAQIRDELDAIGLACIEEPLRREAGEGTDEFYGRLEETQARMSTPICLDESWTNAADLELAVRHSLLTCYAVKIAKLGGIGPTLAFLDLAAARSLAVWMGGMFDAGISKAAHAALSLHPAIAFAGDISDTSRYFVDDPCTPPFQLADGQLDLSRPGLGWAVRRES